MLKALLSALRSCVGLDPSPSLPPSQPQSEKLVSVGNVVAATLDDEECFTFAASAEGYRNATHETLARKHRYFRQAYIDWLRTELRPRFTAALDALDWEKAHYLLEEGLIRVRWLKADDAREAGKGGVA